jgi:Protein of unknown function (DUF3567)
MNMIYNSPNYCVVEFRADDGEVAGFEIVDKASRKEIYLGGTMALSFKETVRGLIASEPSIEEVDDFLSGFDGMMHQTLVLH